MSSYNLGRFAFYRNERCPITLRPLQILGATSNAGKSLVAAALGRLLCRRGEHVEPFKAQNMSLNARVTADGGEIGIAQWLQAQACGVPPRSIHNPILLKPQSGSSQVIVQGRHVATCTAAEYYERIEEFRKAAWSAGHKLREQCDRLVVEGAGSPVELNLLDRDIANLPLAQELDAAILLVVNIELGGFFASTWGTIDLMEPADRKRVVGVLVNNFRGDSELFTSGLAKFENKLGVPIVGVLPHVPDLDLDEEDSVAVESMVSPDPTARLQVRVIKFPHLCNANEFQPLSRCPDVGWDWAVSASDLEDATHVILPGTKTTLQDLSWLHDVGLATALQKHVAEGRSLLGICGGHQMLGRKIDDPDGVEGEAGSAQGLGFLDHETLLAGDKTLTTLTTAQGWHGYEIHLGTGDPSEAEIVLTRPDGSPVGWRQGRVTGTYLHGLFENSGWLEQVLGSGDWPNYRQLREVSLDRLADALASVVDVDALLSRVDSVHDRTSSAEAS